MSSSDHGRLTRRRAGGVGILVALAMGVGACTVQPVYGPTPGGGAVQATLASIEIEPVQDRVGQVVRNKLISELSGGRESANPAYRMKLTVSARQVGLGLTDVENAPTYSVNVSATYQVTRIDTDQVVLRSTAHATATYNTVNQAFANDRAKLDAENRAANSVAGDIALRVAGAVSRGL